MTRKTYAFPDFGSLSRNLDPQWIAQALAEQLLPKRRRRRQCPRVVKKPPARYPVKQVMAVK